MLEATELIIKNELSENEQLIWAGQPKQGIVFRSSDIFMIPFSIMWGGFAIFWEITALLTTSKAKDAPFFFDIIFPLFGLPFVIIGLYLIFGRFIVDAKRREKTYYGLTDKRIIIISGIFSQKVKSMNLRTLTDLSLSEKTNGTGTITFGPTNPMSWWFGGLHWPGMSQPLSYEMINEVKNVYEKIREAQETS